MLLPLLSLLGAASFDIRSYAGLPASVLEARWGKAEEIREDGRYWRGPLERVPRFRDVIPPGGLATQNWNRDVTLAWKDTEGLARDGLAQAMVETRFGRVCYIWAYTPPLSGPHQKTRAQLCARFGLTPPKDQDPDELMGGGCFEGPTGWSSDGLRKWEFRETYASKNDRTAIRLSVILTDFSPAPSSKGEVLCRVSSDHKGQPDEVTYSGLPAPEPLNVSLGRLGIPAGNLRSGPANKGILLGDWPSWEASWDDDDRRGLTLRRPYLPEKTVWLTPPTPDKPR